ncbi:protein eiger [Macrosteles quadrilineatus]|uniref:protein eiger n=1 Tax=Macrosteles quadrilineatus TaxID=74068 RepID=UPI0023E19750|nr:protein eiger [Macrosteles quadrilineatus]
MAHPEQTKGCRAAVVAGVALVVAVIGVVVSASALVALEVRRDQQVRDLQVQLEALRQRVEAMVQQLEHHDRVINTTLQTKSTPKSEPTEEVVYEDEYDYDDEDEYEYDEDDERNTKATVKRTVVQNENGSNEEQTRHKRQIDIHEESTSYSAEQDGKPAPHRTTPPHPPLYQERPPETVRYRHKNSRARSRHASERDSSVEYTRALSQPENFAEQSLSVAAHFTGDTSRYNQRDHHHYYGNDLLYHPHNLFKDWSPASWMTEEDRRLFPIQDGKVTIQKSGVYFVYAQIFYSATHNHCGFHINHNDHEVAQCTTSTAGPGLKRNTCFTALVLRLERQDLLWVKEVEGHRNTSFRHSHSYFGLIMLGSRFDR